MTTTLNYHIIKSINRDAGDKSDFRYSLGYQIKCSKLKLIYHQIPNTWYNFVSEDITIGGNTVTLNGSYNATELANDIDSQLPSSYTVSFSQVTQRLTIANTGSFSMNLSSIPKIARRLGFQASSFSGSSSYTGSYPPDLRRYEYLYVNILEVPNTTQDRMQGYFDANSNRDQQPFQATFTIRVNSNKTDMNIYEEASAYNLFVPNGTNGQVIMPSDYWLHTLRITIVGDDNIPLTSDEIIDWSMILYAE